MKKIENFQNYRLINKFVLGIVDLGMLFLLVLSTAVKQKVSDRKTSNQKKKLKRASIKRTFLEVLCKRYEHPKTENRFVRKIFTGRNVLNDR